jgi:uncharacterized protein YihD (DUF1040 family)
MLKTEGDVNGRLSKLTSTYTTKETYKLDTAQVRFEAFKVKLGGNLVIAIERHRELTLELQELDETPNEKSLIISLVKSLNSGDPRLELVRTLLALVKEPTYEGHVDSLTSWQTTDIFYKLSDKVDKKAQRQGRQDRP